MAYSFFPSPTHTPHASFLFSPTAGKPPLVLPASEQPKGSSGSPSARSSMVPGHKKLYRHMRYGSKDLDKLLTKAAKLEAHLLQEPVDVKAYQRKWYSDNKGKSEENKHTISLPVIKQQKPRGSGCRSRHLSPEAPQITLTSPDAQSPLPSKEARFPLPTLPQRLHRKQSEQELDKIVALCDTEETHRKLIEDDINKAVKARGSFRRSTSLGTKS